MPVNDAKLTRPPVHDKGIIAKAFVNTGRNYVDKRGRDEIDNTKFQKFTG